MSKHLPKKTHMTALITAAFLSIGGSATAQGDLYYMHNASAYYIWSAQDACQADMRNNNNECVTFGGKPLCGRQLYSTPATLGVAIDKAKRKDLIIIRHSNGNSEFCRITP